MRLIKLTNTMDADAMLIFMRWHRMHKICSTQVSTNNLALRAAHSIMEIADKNELSVTTALNALSVYVYSCASSNSSNLALISLTLS